MIIREAITSDIPEIMRIRHAVKENRLSNPDAVSEADCIEYLTNRGKGWVCMIEGKLAGFSIVDLQDNNVWALFVDPEHQGKGVGKELHDTLLSFYFSKERSSIWLGTLPDTKAEKFYLKNGWRKVGTRPNGEVKFEMSYLDYTN